MSIYNPGSEIIKAFLEGHHARRLKEETALQQERQEEEKRQHIETLKQHQKEFDLTHAMQQALHNVQIQEHLGNIQRGSAETGLTPPGASETQSLPQGQDTFRMLNDIMLPGAGNQVAPGMEGVAPQIDRNVTLSSGQQFTVPSAFNYAQQQAQREATLLRPQTQAKIDVAEGTAKARLPGQITLETLKSQLANQIEDKKAAVSKTVATMNSDARRYAAELGLQGRKYAADHQKVSGDQIDPDEMEAMSQLVATGKTPLPTGKNGIHIAAILHSQGMVPLDKATEDKIKALGSLPLMFKDLEDFANKNLSDSKGFGPFSTYLQSKIPQSDIASEMASIKVNAGPIARIFEGQTGRLAMQQMNLAMEAMTSGSISKEQGIKRVAELKKKADAKLYNEILAGIPQKQQEMIITGMGLPYSFSAPPKAAPSTPKEPAKIKIEYEDGSPSELIDNTPANRLKHGKLLGAK